MTWNESATPACQLLYGIEDWDCVLAGGAAIAKVLFPVEPVEARLVVAFPTVPFPVVLAIGEAATAGLLAAEAPFDDVPLDILPS